MRAFASIFLSLRYSMTVFREKGGKPLGDLLEISSRAFRTDDNFASLC